MRDASRHCRRKYGDSSSPRHSGQYCSQVERFLFAFSRSGSRSGANTQSDIAIVVSASGEISVRSLSRTAMARGIRRSKRADHIAPPTPKTPANDRGEIPLACPTRCSQLDSSSSGFGSMDMGHRSRAISRYRSRISTANLAQVAAALTTGSRAPAPGGAAKAERSTIARGPIS